VKVLISTLAVFALSLTAAPGEERADQLVRAFIGTCVDELPRLDKIEAMANSMKWKELTGEDLKAMEPQKQGGVTKGWLADVAGTPPFFLGTSKNKDDKSDVLACSVANPYAPSADVQDSLKRFLNLKEPQAQTSEGGLLTQLWIIDVSGVHLWVTLNDSSPTNDPGVTLGALTKQ
jgi:hypothetical protein